MLASVNLVILAVWVTLVKMAPLVHQLNSTQTFDDLGTEGHWEFMTDVNVLQNLSSLQNFVEIQNRVLDRKEIDVGEEEEEGEEEGEEGEEDNWRDPIENSDYFQGDIMIDDPGQFFTDVQDRSALSKKRRLWSDNTVPYVIATSFTKTERSIIFKAMKEFHSETCLRFVPRANEKDYIKIAKGDGCWSYWGRIGKGEQKLSLGNGCLAKGIVLHELMHAVGFVHEHSRPDRDDYITIVWDAIKTNKKDNFEKLNWSTVKSLGVGYDYGSIMHYKRHTFAKNKARATIKPRDPSAKIGQRKALSKKDIRKVNLLYNCNGQGGQPVHVVTSSPSTTTTYGHKEICRDHSPYCYMLINIYGFQCRPFSWISHNCQVTCKTCSWKG